MGNSEAPGLKFSSEIENLKRDWNFRLGLSFFDRGALWDCQSVFLCLSLHSPPPTTTPFLCCSQRAESPPHSHMNPPPHTGIRTYLPLGRTPKGAYSTRGRSRHVLETPFWETLLRTLFYCKTHSNPLLRTLLRTLPQKRFQTCPAPSQNPSQNAVLPYAPLGVHPIPLPKGPFRTKNSTESPKS